MSLGTRRTRCTPCALLFALLFCSAAQAQLRIVDYNTANGSFPSGNNTLPRTGMDLVLDAIGNEIVGGIAKPIDVLILQEQDLPTTTTQAYVNLLNGIYGAGTYARSTVVNGPLSSDLHQALVYNTMTVQLVSELAFGTTGSAAAARQPIRFQMRPVGYDASADFYIYNSHYKADSTATDKARRLAEAQEIRANADALGEGTHIIYAGDYNIQSSSESMYTALLSAGNGQAFDPINTPGSWSNNSSFAAVHTQSPHDGSDGLVTSGMDDRFDFQLVTGEFLDSEGLSYISGSYHPFGNNGTTYNQAINAASNTYPLTSAQLDALAHVSDHLPVVADYQLPALMFADLGTVPSNVTLGSLVNIDVMVENIADVLTANGADELDYTLSVSGALFGGVSSFDLALGGGSTHQITLDTSLLGLQSGMVTVASTSQSVGNPLFNFPISFTVDAQFLEADFNQDFSVDGLDLAEWQADYGLNGESDADFDGDTDGRDFLIWQQQFGQSTLPPLVATATAAVPEPTGLLLATLFGGLLIRRR